MLENLVASGRVVDLALAVIVVEAALLALLARRLGRGPGALALVLNGAAGAGLLLALRAALTGAGPGATAAFLALSLVAHVADVAARFRAPRR